MLGDGVDKRSEDSDRCVDRLAYLPGSPACGGDLPHAGLPGTPSGRRCAPAILPRDGPVPLL